MTDGYTHISIPASREPVTLLAVDRAVSELRRGRMVVLSGGGGEAVLAEARAKVLSALAVEE